MHCGAYVFFMGSESIFSASNIISFSAVVVAICSFYTTHKRIKQSEHHDVLSVRPFLQTRSNLYDHIRTLEVENAGIGPAVIRRCMMVVGGLEYEMNRSGFARMADANGITKAQFRLGTIPELTHVMAGDKVLLIEAIDFDKLDEAYQRKITGVFEAMTIAIEYESMYGESFTTDDR